MSNGRMISIIWSIDVYNRVCIHVQYSLLQLFDVTVKFQARLGCRIGGDDCVRIGQDFHKIVLQFVGDRNHLVVNDPHCFRRCGWIEN